MKLQLFKTLWGHPGSLDAAVTQAVDMQFDGIEGPAPQDSATRNRFRQMLDESGLAYIAEITTAGSYVPDRTADLQRHLDSFTEKLEQCLPLQPSFVTCLGGCDAWPEEQSAVFFHEAETIATDAGITVSFETHRSRSLFNPWVTERIVQQLPGIKLTGDFSHWCVVCERLMDSELDTIGRLIPNVYHMHARVGYEQGPQVPHPAAPEYDYALRSHQRLWRMIWDSQLKSGRDISTMTPEYGPDGYLQEQPFSRKPVADLWQLNCWMAAEERDDFAQWAGA